MAREMEKFRVDAIPELVTKDKIQFQRALEVLPKVRANYVLVICKPENLATILERVCLTPWVKNYRLIVGILL